MSDSTKSALDDAIAAHLDDENEGILMTGYVLHVSGIRPDAPNTTHTVYTDEYMTGQSFHISLGLAHALLGCLTIQDE